MTFLVLLFSAIGSWFLIGKYLKLPRSLTYTLAILFAIFTWQGYAILSVGYLDPFSLIASLVAIPTVLAIVIVSDVIQEVKAERSIKLRMLFLDVVIALLLTVGPLSGYLIYTTSDAYEVALDTPQWDSDEWKAVKLAVSALQEYPSRSEYIGLAKKSVAYLSSSNVYRVMFIFRGHELAEVTISKDLDKIIDVKVRANPE